MIYALIKDGKCINTIICESLNIANKLLDFIDADTITELPDGFGIGDSYIDGVWTKQEPLPQMPSDEDRISALEETMNFLLGL